MSDLNRRLKRMQRSINRRLDRLEELFMEVHEGREDEDLAKAIAVLEEVQETATAAASGPGESNEQAE